MWLDETVKLLFYTVNTYVLNSLYYRLNYFKIIILKVNKFIIYDEF